MPARELDVERGKPARDRRARQDAELFDRINDSDDGLAQPSARRSRGRTDRTYSERSGMSAKTNESTKSFWQVKLRYFSWAYFTGSMATGGLANAIHSVPPHLRFHGLYAIGVIFFLLNIVIFLANCVCMTVRALSWPEDFRKSIITPGESIFIPASVLSLATVLINTSQYGLRDGKTGPWLVETMIVLYWIYLIIAICFSAGIYLLYWSKETFSLKSMTPQWIFPAYPLLLVGPFAGTVSNPSVAAKGTMALAIIVSGVAVQGIGFMLSVMAYGSYLYRLMSQRLPPEAARPSMFISVGPTGFTITAIINMGQYLPQVVSADFMGNGELAGQVTRILANWAGIWLYGLAVWFFVTSVGAHYPVLVGFRFDIAPSFFALIFPNSALCTATFALAVALDNNRPIAVVGCVLTCCLVATWLVVVAFLIRGFASGKLLAPPPPPSADSDSE